jgi:hypothetical protein
MKLRHAAIAAGLLISCPQDAFAQSTPACHLRIEAARTSWVIEGYDPFGMDAPIGEFDLTYVNDGDAPCQLVSSFDLSNEAYGLDQGSQPRIRYFLLDRTDDQDVTPLTGSTSPNPNRPFLTVAPHGQKVARFRLTVEPTNIRGDGLFLQNVRIDAEDGDGAALASKQLQLGLDVQPAALVGMSGTFRTSQGRALVDLGELHPGIAPTLLNLYVQSTRPYRISVESQNSGYLKLPNTNWAIPYQLLLADRTLSLSGASEYSSTVGTALARQSLPLGFSIGDTANLQAGTYSDVITVSIAPQ